jgi:hypothetical protein
MHRPLINAVWLQWTSPSSIAARRLARHLVTSLAETMYQADRAVVTYLHRLRLLFEQDHESIMEMTEAPCILGPKRIERVHDVAFNYVPRLLVEQSSPDALSFGRSMTT